MTQRISREISERIEQALISVATSRNWNQLYAKFGKRGSQTLLVHSLNVFSLTRIIGEKLYGLSDDELFIASIAGFLHDIQKANTTWQSAAIAFMNGVQPDELSFKHDDGSEESLQEITDLLDEVAAKSKLKERHHKAIVDLSKRILNIIVYTHDSSNRAISRRRQSQVGTIDPLAPLIRLADAIASIKDASEIVKKSRDLDIPLDKEVSFEYHQISQIRGLVSSYLNEALIQLMGECGYIPLLYFGNGAAYLSIGSPSTVESTRVRIMKIIHDKFREFQKSEIYNIGMTNAVLGPLTQTNWPCLNVVRKNDMKKLVRFLSSQPAMNKDYKYGKSVYAKAKEKKEYSDAITEFVKLTGSERDSILALMTSDFNLLVYFADFVKNYERFVDSHGREDRYELDVDSWLDSVLGAFTLADLRRIGVTSTAPERVEAITKLWHLTSNPLHLSRDRREIIEARFIEVMQKIVEVYGDCAPDIFTEQATEVLLADIQHLPLSILSDKEMREIGSHPYERYKSGKRIRKRVCNLCGAVGEEDAAAALFGDGSQKFSNLLPAGVKIGAGKKAQICVLCGVEATLRAFFFRNPPELTLVVLPDLSLSPEAYSVWRNNVDQFSKMEKLGLSVSFSWNMYRVYEALAAGESLDSSHQLMKLLKPTRASVNRLAKYLETERTDPKHIKYEVLENDLKEVTFESIARANSLGEIEIDPRHLVGYKAPSSPQTTAYFTPSHMFIFLQRMPNEDSEESNSTMAIRTLLLALIISEIFHARVIGSEGFQSISDINVRGLVRINLPAPAELALQRVGIQSTIQPHQHGAVLTTLAALTLVAFRYVKRLGKDRLLRLASMNRGAILRRAEMEQRDMKRSTKRQLIQYLSVLPAVASIEDNS